jgi:hypothetical protein
MSMTKIEVLKRIGVSRKYNSLAKVLLIFFISQATLFSANSWSEPGFPMTQAEVLTHLGLTLDTPLYRGTCSSFCRGSVATWNTNGMATLHDLMNLFKNETYYRLWGVDGVFPNAFSTRGMPQLNFTTDISLALDYVDGSSGRLLQTTVGDVLEQGGIISPDYGAHSQGGRGGVVITPGENCSQRGLRINGRPPRPPARQPKTGIGGKLAKKVTAILTFFGVLNVLTQSSSAQEIAWGLGEEFDPSLLGVSTTREILFSFSDEGKAETCKRNQEWLEFYKNGWEPKTYDINDPALFEELMNAPDRNFNQTGEEVPEPIMDPGVTNVMASQSFWDAVSELLGE